MEPNDLYRPPQADLTAATPSGDGNITPRMVELMGKTRPWVMLLAILGLLITGLLMVIGVIGAIGMMAAGQGAEMAGLALVYLFLAIFYFFPCFFLLKYAKAIKRLTSGGGPDALEEAIERQYIFWRLIGIITLVFVMIYALILVGVVAMGIFAAASGQ